MIDLQSSGDDRGINIDKVGVAGLSYPIVVLDRSNERQNTVASISMSVDLPRQFKGTHMSRFIEVLNLHHGEITLRTMPAILQSLRDSLQAATGHMEIRFPYFVEKRAPVSGATATMDHDCWFDGVLGDGVSRYVIGVDVPVTSLCPCSKAISDYGAHNQRGHVRIEVETVNRCSGEPEIIWIEELIEIAENAASSPVYPLLKRPDERHVTMAAYEKPAFVEDIVRDTARELQRDKRVQWFRVVVINQESIHNHDAFAEIAWSRP